MAVSNAMFLFEVVVESVQSFVESRQLIIRSDFADIFSLELKDPKQLHIVMPEPPPLPPETGKKKKGAKPKKPKKGKKGQVELPPPEPMIQSGQSVLFTSTPQFLIQTMRKYPMEISLWSKEDNLIFIGATPILWDELFLQYLERIADFIELPPITVKEEYNIFGEGTAKLMAKLGVQVKLSYLSDKVTTSFRTLSEDPSVKKYLYTGINSKTTSYLCTMKTTNEDFVENSNKIENNYIKDKPKSTKVVYADYKNAPGANLTFFNEGDYCCMNNADKPPESIYKSPETLPDIDFIIDYIRKVVVSCNDNMRMLTPRPTIRPRVKATDIDRLCYCKETRWPDGDLAENFKNTVQTSPCPVCEIAKERAKDARGATFDIGNIRGPCGRVDCRIARDLRTYIEHLVEEDKIEININDIFGPCSSKDCTLAAKIQQFLRHEGAFSHGKNKEGLTTQCDCIKVMQNELSKKKSCDSVCSKDCTNTGSEEPGCEGVGCPFINPQVYNVYYFTVEYEVDPKNDQSSTSTKHKYCASDCPSTKASGNVSCSRTTCSSLPNKTDNAEDKCVDPVCPDINKDYPPSPADSNVVIHFEDINNLCCVKTCDVAEKVKDFIIGGVMNKEDKVAIRDEDPCFCDCVCTFKFSKKTTYCSVCGGYECLGEDMKDMPVYAQPLPCPVYHKLYDKKYIKVESPWPEETTDKNQKLDKMSIKSSKTTASKLGPSRERSEKRLAARSVKSVHDRKNMKNVSVEKVKEVKKETKKVGKFTANVEEPVSTVEKKPEPKYPYPQVPKHMGWMWTAEDIPGMKARPKWRPGAVNKILVRRYRAIREGLDIIAKKKKALLGKKKKVEAKPTLTVKKQDGEFTVQMEVLRKYSKERLLFQYPYEDKQPLVYTVGKTEEEKQRKQKQRERKERRETRRRCRFIQSSFRDKCQEICLKAYNQAIGVLPLPNPNDPACPCYTSPNGDLSPPIDSCSCSDNDSLSSSDTDGDEWSIEFSPPAARWDIRAKHPPVIQDNDCQYNYLDFKVKLLDKYGNPVPRYFKGPDCKQECSDLGGFWGPGRVWLEINRDGYIGPDCRWVPMSFTGPDGMVYSAEDGYFTDNTGKLLRIGIDGYIDKDTKWVWYKNRPRNSKSKSVVSGDTKKPEKPMTKPEIPSKFVGKESKASGGKNQPANTTQSGATLKKNITDGKNQAKKTVSYPGKAPLVMNLSVNYEGRKQEQTSHTDKLNAIDQKRLTKYREIMKGLEMYDDFVELKPPVKASRASNTPRKKISPYKIRGVSYRHTKPLTPMFSSNASSRESN